eukprot:TRINITY_DN9570_c0_g1_i1.p1 TRINITY_DN9570_c0_g1~~TRINITY_DN9570_c0_g1_i1.p1  ORF type:complete len:523 (+),score=158.22 TRINITY_DN9570_c0_g1_i1:130-1698(+)
MSNPGEEKQTSAKPSEDERVMRDVPAPISTFLDHKTLFKKKSASEPTKTIDISALQTHLFGEGRLDKEDVLWIIERATEIFAEEPNVLDVPSPVTVCGDVHGQFYDLIKLFEVGGSPADTRYLFLGDYVDRGSFSIEVVLLLYSYKILFPSTFLMIRGNHECRHLTQYFTFKSECIRKYDIEVYELIMDSFDALPLSAIMNKQFLCVHGGLSPDIQTIDDIRQIDRFCEPPQSGPMCDLLWSDPMENYTPETKLQFVFNEVRGCSYTFSYRAVCNFLQKNNLLSVIRAHEAQDQGYRMHLKNDATGFPTVITLFSAPNYLDAYNNKGAVLRYENNVMNIRQFNHSPHPYWLPNFMDVFSWSLPFVAEKVAELVLAMLNLCDDEKEEEAELKKETTKVEKEQQRERLRKKVLGVSKMLRMYKILRQERETLMQIKTFTPENKIPAGLLTKGVDAIKDALGNFEKAKEADQLNEKRPPAPPQRTGSSSNLKLITFLKKRTDSLSDLRKAAANNSPPAEERKADE